MDIDLRLHFNICNNMIFPVQIETIDTIADEQCKRGRCCFRVKPMDRLSGEAALAVSEPPFDIDSTKSPNDPNKSDCGAVGRQRLAATSAHSKEDK